MTRLMERLAYAVLFSGLAFAQGFGTIVGTVTDSTGALIPSAKVRVTDELTSATRDTTANEQGYFVIPSLRPSTYTLSVDAAGFALSVRKGILLQADESVTANQTVSVQQSSQTIEVVRLMQAR